LYTYTPLPGVPVDIFLSIFIIANYTLYVYHLKVQTHMASQKATAYLSAMLAKCPLDKPMKIQIKPAGKALVLVLTNSPSSM
jgi:hypothetical protein